ncbi:MAG: hypothetical protein VX519_11890 [Myxococcota bacterium]|nr:hypothetical protein [Myxococcota bacterium]
MSTAPLLLCSAMAIALLYAGSRAVPTHDLYIFLAMGEWMADHRTLMTEEIYTWTAQGTEFANATWAFSICSWLLFDTIGLDGLRIFNGVLLTLAVGLMARASLSAGADPRAAAMAALYTWAMTLQNTVIRGQTWVFVGMSLLAWITAKPRPNRFLVPAGLLIGLVWSNFHGSFPAGIVFLGALAVGGAWEHKNLNSGRTPLLLAAAMAVGVSLGPNGIEIWSYALENSRLSKARLFVEWMPAPLWSVKSARLYGAFVLWAVLLYRERLRTPPAHLLLLLGFGVLATTGSRFIAWFGLATALPFAMRLSRTMAPEHGIPTRLGKPVTLLLASLWCIFLVRGLTPGEQTLSEDTPIELVDAIRSSARSGRVLNPPEYGGYITQRLYPDFQTSGDIRTWIYDDATWNIYLSFTQPSDDWEERLDALGVTHLLLTVDHHQEWFIPAVNNSKAWRLLAETDFGAAYMRTER